MKGRSARKRTREKIAPSLGVGFPNAETDEQLGPDGPRVGSPRQIDDLIAVDEDGIIKAKPIDVVTID